MQGRHIAGAAGVLGCVLGAAGGLVADLFNAPATTATSAEIAGSIETNRAALLAGTLLSATAVSLWVVFGAGVWLRLRRETDGDGLAPACFAFGFVGFTTLLFAGFTAFLVLAYRNADVADPRMLYDLTFGLLAMSGAPTAIALGAYAASVFSSTTALPRGTAWLALIGAAAHVALLASFVIADGFFSLQGQVITVIPATLFAWITATGIVLLREPAVPATSPI